MAPRHRVFYIYLGMAPHHPIGRTHCRYLLWVEPLTLGSTHCRHMRPDGTHRQSDHAAPLRMTIQPRRHPSPEHSCGTPSHESAGRHHLAISWRPDRNPSVLEPLEKMRHPSHLLPFSRALSSRIRHSRKRVRKRGHQLKSLGSSSRSGRAARLAISRDARV